MAPNAALGQIYRGMVAFVIAQIVFIALLVAFPATATWLPGTM